MGAGPRMASSMRMANWNWISGSLVFFAFNRYISSVFSAESKDAEFPGLRWEWSNMGGGRAGVA